MTDLEPWLREILRCPAGRHELLDGRDEKGAPVLECAVPCPEGAGSAGGRLQFPVRDGIPVLLLDDARVIPA